MLLSLKKTPRSRGQAAGRRIGGALNLMTACFLEEKDAITNNNPLHHNQLHDTTCRCFDRVDNLQNHNRQ